MSMRILGAIVLTLIASCLNGTETERMATPLVLEPNWGQTDTAVRWAGRTSSYQLFVTDSQLVLRLLENTGAKQSVIRIGFGGKHFDGLDGTLPTGGHSNYFLGNSKSKWVRSVPHHKQLKINGVAPGVDLNLYGADKHFEYDLILKPGTDTQELELTFDGAKSLAINQAGDLEIHTQTGATLTQRKPLVYQSELTKRRMVEARYVKLSDSKVRFEVGSHDRKKPLIIDPVLAYSTFLGGAGQELGNNDGAFPGLAVDSAGSAYLSGSSRSLNYPTVGAIQLDPGDNDLDAVITKLSPDGSQIVYSTYLGGTGNDTGANIALDSAGSAYVTGFTYASNFPLVNPIHGDRNHREAFVSKLSPDGSSLVFSTYLGGNNDDRASAIAVDGAGNAYVAGTTYSNDFPVLNAYQASQSSVNSDAFVAKITPMGALVYSTYLGGSSGDDFAYGITVDSAGAAYVVGAASPNLPLVSPIQAVPQGGADALIAKIGPNGNQLLFSTLYGGNGDDRAFDVKVDSGGFIYIGGVTTSANFPLLNSPQGFGGNTDAFALKINQTTSSVVYSAVFGGSSSDDAYSLAIDAAGNAYFGGATSSTNLPLVNSLYSDQGGEDGYVAMLGPNGGPILFSTYFGGSSNPGDFFSTGSDRVQKVAVDSSGNIYLMGTTSSSLNFPLLNAVDTTNQQGELFLAKLSSDIPFTVSIAPSSAVVSAAASVGSIAVTANTPSTVWGAISSSPWLSIVAPLTSVTGNGVIQYSVADNPGPGQRAGSIMAGGRLFSILQSPPSYSVSPTSLNAGGSATSVSTSVTATPATATWTATSNSPWITVTSPVGLSSGNASVVLSVASNPFASQRTGTVLVAGTLVTLTQNGTSGLGGTITTIAGNGTAGTSGDGGASTNATVSSPSGITFDPAGNLYIVGGGYRIRRIAPNGIISTIAGTGVRGNGGDGGPATSAQINDGYHISSDAQGNLLYADVHNGRIRQISSTGIMTRIAGTSPFGFGGDGGPALNATLYFPFGATKGPDGNIYIADYGNHRIRKIDSAGIISTFAGTGNCTFGGDNGPALAASFCYPYMLAFDSAGNMLIADTVNHRIRRISTTGIVSTFAGNGATAFAGDGGPATQASLYSPTGLTIGPDGMVYIADSQNHRIRVVNTAGIIGTIAGNGVLGYNGDNIAAIQAQLNNPAGVAIDSSGNLYITDANNQRVRKVTFPQSLPVPTITLNLSSVTYNGTPRSVTGTVTGALNENLGTPSITYDGSAVAPTNAGAYLVSATYPGNSSYSAASTSGSFTILKATPDVTWPNPAAIPAGTPLSGTQLNASASFLGSPLPGNFSYNPAVGTVLAVGTQSLSTLFSPTDATNFQTVNANRNLTVFNCTYNLSVTAATVSGAAGSDNFTVTTESGCTIAPTTATPWLSLGVAGNVVTYSFTANNSGADRAGTINAGGATFTLTQLRNLVSLTFQTNPAGLSYSVNGITYSAGQTLSFPVGSAVPLAAITPQLVAPGIRNSFASWSQGGAASQTLTVPSSNASYTINYNTEYQLSTAVSPARSGSLLGGNFYLAGSTASMNPLANPGYSFNNYSGDLSGNAIPGSILMNGPKSVTANFFGIPSLNMVRASAAGPVSARIWTISVTNSATVPASAASVDSFTLTQTAGGACTSPPSISPLPGNPNLGTIPAGGITALPVTINFTNCPAAARFTLTVNLTATGYSVNRSIFNLFR